MPLKNTIFYLFVFLFISSCEGIKNKNGFSISEKDRITLAKQFHETSNYFLQPSELYRKYKDSALQAQPNNVDYMQRLSYSYKKVGEHIKAMEILNKAVEIDTANGKADVLEYRAWTLLYYYRDYEGVVRDVNLIKKITGNTYNSCWGEPCDFHKGQALYKLGKYNEAIETLTLVNIEENKLGFDINDNYMVFFYIGRSYAQMKGYDKAIEYYNKAIASVDKFPEAYYQLGLVYEIQGNKKKAFENFKLAELYVNYKMGEPYIERFDEVFPYMIKKELINLSNETK
ncbi:tetratricopeptide repeat protein [Gaetbulibacter jejuensis]|uniref:Tetratricopeptide repeat protein n=1 Tax=Gaetbulibacter jejuensis TaxID=584607 RepID=A0ABN1JN60_9FLAO